MAVKKKDEVEEMDESMKIMNNLLNEHKVDHYNFEETIYYKTPSSSAIMNAEMDGGLEPGAHRFIGVPSGGKTSAALDYMKNFLVNEKLGLVKGLYFRCEGKLSPKIQKRSGIKFVEDVKLWEPGTCLIIDSNVFEFVFKMIREHIMNNKQKCKFFFILDSLDMMARREDLQKPFEEAQMVAGGSLLTSVFFKKVSIALAKRGHIAVLISQVRDTIKINTYEKTNPKQGGASGGHAVEHAAGWVLDFLPRFTDDIIREGGLKTGEPLGHFAKCKILKADNESYLREIRYPICYQRTDGNSIWKEKEIRDMMEMCERITAHPEKTGKGWFKIAEDTTLALVEAGFEGKTEIYGDKNVDKWIEQTPGLIEFLTKYVGYAK